MARYDREWRDVRGRPGRESTHGRRGYDSSFAPEPREPRPPARGYDRESGYDRGWGMTRMYRHMLRDRPGPYDPPLRGGTEYVNSGRPLRAQPAGRERPRAPRYDTPLRYPRGRHAVGYVRDRYDDNWL
jgi:hypothetical protein